MKDAASSKQQAASSFKPLEQQAQEIIGHYEEKKAATLPLLRLVQEHAGYVTPEGERWVAEQVGVSLAHVREVVSFYTLFHRQPVGTYHFQVCGSTACWLMDGDNIVQYLSQKLGIEPGQTTPDGKFTLSTVECLCACELAPMLQLNDRYVGPLTKARIDELLAECR